MWDTVTAASRIIAGTALYRVRRREGGNLATSITLAAALALPWGDILWRLGFGLLLNLFAYVLNDCFDVNLDLRAAGRDRERTRFLAAHPGAGWTAVAMLGLAVATVGAWHGVGLLICFVANAAVIAAYSAWLKRRPALDLLAMGAWGVSMAMVGFPLESRAGWWLAGLLGLLCMVTEVVQVIRDEDSDRASGIRTTAVVLGQAASAWVGRGLVVASAAYATLFLHRWLGLAILLGLGVPLGTARIGRSWDLLRAVFGLSWLGILAAYYLGGGLDGWIDLG